MDEAWTICDKCDAEYQTANYACPVCFMSGIESTTPTIYCSHCGNTILYTKTTCPHCSFPIEVQVVSPQTSLNNLDFFNDTGLPLKVAPTYSDATPIETIKRIEQSLEDQKERLRIAREEQIDAEIETTFYREKENRRQERRAMALIFATLALPVVIVLSLHIDPDNMSNQEAAILWASIYIPLPAILGIAYLLKKRKKCPQT